MPKWLFYSLLAIVLWGVWGLIPDAKSAGVSSYMLQLVSTAGLLPVAAALLLSRNLKQGKNHVRGSVYAFLTGVSASVGNWAYFQSIDLGGEGSTVYPLTGIYPLVTVILAFVLLREKMNLVQLLGLAVALAALILFGIVAAGGAPEGSWFKRAMAPWMAYALVTLVLFGVAAVLQKLSTNNISNELSTVWFAVGFLPVAAFILLQGKGIDWHLSGKDWGLCLAAGVIIGIGALTLFAAYRHGKASVVTAVTALNPAVTFILGVPLFHQSFSFLKCVAIALALGAGVALTYEGKPSDA
jgi:uncharacterized membrane protein